jgi:hypothetical protein
VFPSQSWTLWFQTTTAPRPARLMSAQKELESNTDIPQWHKSSAAMHKGCSHHSRWFKGLQHSLRTHIDILLHLSVRIQTNSFTNE